MNITDPTVKKSQSFREWFIQVVIAFLLASVVHLFVMEIVSMRETTMLPNLHKGDWVIISKLHYGPRTPATWLKIPLTEPFIGDSIPTFWAGLQMPMLRLPGIVDIQRNDVICFNHPRLPAELPPDLRIKMLARCVGLPGDSVKIENLQTAHFQEDTLNRQYAYRFIADDERPLKYLQGQGLTEIYTLKDFYIVNCAPQMAVGLAQQPGISQLARLVTPRGMDTETTFPYSSLFAWNRAFFGPLWIPKKGTTIPLNDSTLALYDQLLAYEQGDNIRFTSTGYEQNTVRRALLAGKPISQYTFKYNYYFVLNDNRSHLEADSRRFGLIPEPMIIGKAWMILAAYDDYGFNWERCFKIVH